MTTRLGSNFFACAVHSHQGERFRPDARDKVSKHLDPFPGLIQSAVQSAVTEAREKTCLCVCLCTGSDIKGALSWNGEVLTANVIGPCHLAQSGDHSITTIIPSRTSSMGWCMYHVSITRETKEGSQQLPNFWVSYTSTVLTQPVCSRYGVGETEEDREQSFSGAPLERCQTELTCTGGTLASSLT